MRRHLAPLLLAVLATMGSASAIPTPASTLTFEVSGPTTVEVVAENGAIPHVVSSPAGGSSSSPHSQQFALYRHGDGRILYLGMGISHASGEAVEQVSSVPDHSNRYVLHVVGDGTVAVGGAAALRSTSATVFPFGAMTFNQPMDSPNLFEGGHVTTLTPPDALRDDGHALAVYARTRRQPVNVSAGYICLEGKGTTCEDTKVRHDEVAMTPIDDDTTLVWTAAALAESPDEGGPLSAIVDHRRPAAYAVDEWFSVVVVPARIITD